jgi:hypothetical protein
MSESPDSLLVVGRGHPMDFVICLCYRAESKENREFIEMKMKNGYKPGMTYIANSKCYTSRDLVDSGKCCMAEIYEIKDEKIPVIACEHCLYNDTICLLVHFVKYCDDYDSIYNSRVEDRNIRLECICNYILNYNALIKIQRFTRKYLFRKLISSEKFFEWYYHPDNIGGVLAKKTFEKNMLEYNSAYYWENSVDNLTKLVKFQRYTRKFLARKLAKSERRITAWVQYLEDLRVPSVVY